MPGGNDQRRTPSTQVVFELIVAIGDKRIQDVLARVHPDVVCQPVARPGLSQYVGHDGMVEFVSNLDAAFGQYRLDIEEMTSDGGTQVTVRTRVIAKAGNGARELPPITSVYTLEDGLVKAIESEYSTDGGSLAGGPPADGPPV
jgi:SnoaL-like protein